MRVSIVSPAVGALVLALTVVAPGAARAEPDALSRVVRHGCFARRYDADHLLAHPRQRVEAVWLRHEGARGGDRRTELTVVFRLRGATVGGTAYCRADRCALEGDGGTFTLRRSGRDIELAVGDRLRIEGAHGFSPDLARSADDRVFRLHPSDARGCPAVAF